MGGLLHGVLTRGGFGPERVAEGVWRVQGNPGRMNVFLIEHEGELVQFDAGGRCMLEQVRAAVAVIGRPLREVVLGHAHTDHRGTAPFLGVPVRCHPDEVIDAQGSGGWRYWGDLAGMEQPARWVQARLMHSRFWDGGPVGIAGTVAEGHEVADFEVLHMPGHAPGQIALLRRADGVALTSDVFYAVDNWGRDTPPRLPGSYYNEDTAGAVASLRRLAALDAQVALPGHGDPVRGDVRGALLAAAEEAGA